MLLNIPLKVIKKENKANRQAYEKDSLNFLSDFFKEFLHFYRSPLLIAASSNIFKFS